MYLFSAYRDRADSRSVLDYHALDVWARSSTLQKT